MIKALGTLAEPARQKASDPSRVDRLLALNSAAYRLAVCALGREDGAEDVVLAAYRRVLNHLVGVPSEREERVWLLREVIRAAKRRAVVPARTAFGRPVNRVARYRPAAAKSRLPVS